MGSHRLQRRDQYDPHFDAGPCSFRRVQVEPDHLDELGLEVLGRSNLERVDVPGLQVVVLPDARHCGFAEAVTLRP